MSLINKIYLIYLNIILYLKEQGKKKNQKVMSLQEFNQVTPLASEAPPQSSINWADEMEKLDDTGSFFFENFV